MNIRNVAIIAHVDHGKTTLVDALLRQSHTHLNKEQDSSVMIMDSNDLEKERGITIFSKNASVTYKEYKINIIDTPGHADFGGEVERVLGMADGCLLLIDAKEGPMPQTRFVLKQALKMGLKIIVVVNKIDKTGARSEWAVGKTFDLFVELGADESAAFFPTIYASGRDGLAGLESDLSKMTDISPIFESIVNEIPAPSGDVDKPLQILVSAIGGDTYKGRIGTGKIANGKITKGQEIVRFNRNGEPQKFRVAALMSYVGLEKMEVDSAIAGDIVSVAGIADVTIGETIADPINPVALPVIAIEEPTIKMTFKINDSPFSGREGEFKTSREIRERLFRELETDVALRVEETTGGEWIVSGRGELHLAILIERMRREGYEFQVSRPEALIKIVDGKKLTAYERVFIEVPSQYSGVIIQKMGERKGMMQNMVTQDSGSVELEFIIPTYNLFGYRNEFLTDTKGLGIINTMFEKFDIDAGEHFKRTKGSLVAFESGTTRLYGLINVQDRGQLFVGPNVDVYKGQVVGMSSREGDLRINVCKEKKLSNMRSKGDGGMEHFNVPLAMSLEEAIEYIDDSELVEVTPKNIRLRKIILDESEARKNAKLGK